MPAAPLVAIDLSKAGGIRFTSLPLENACRRGTLPGEEQLPLRTERMGVGREVCSEGRDLSVEAERDRPRSGGFRSWRGTCWLEPLVGVRKVGASFCPVWLLPRFCWLGGLPRGAFTGERTGSLPAAALRESPGETTAAAAAMS